MNITVNIKNLNWPEANQLAIYKHCQVFELGAAVKQIQELVRHWNIGHAMFLRVNPEIQSNLYITATLRT